jgi:hypothetical protein
MQNILEEEQNSIMINLFAVIVCEIHSEVSYQCDIRIYRFFWSLLSVECLLIQRLGRCHTKYYKIQQ